jgi:hypothetical protein
MIIKKDYISPNAYVLIGYGVYQCECAYTWHEWYVYQTKDYILLMFNIHQSFTGTIDSLVEIAYEYFAHIYDPRQFPGGNSTHRFATIENCEMPVIKHVLTTQYPDFTWSWK